MKSLFRYAILILLVAILAAVLFRKKQQIEFESAGAKFSNYEIPVQTNLIQKTTPRNLINTSGIVESSEEVIVLSTVQGRVESVNIIVGKKVNENEILATVDNYIASQEYLIANQAHQQLQKDYERYEKLAAEDAVARQQLEQLRLQMDGANVKQQLLLKRLEDTKIKAPVNGVINQVFVKQGSTIGMGTPVCEIVNPDGLKITAHIGKSDVGLMKPGTAVVLSENFGTGKRHNGIITGAGVKPDRTGRYPLNIAITSTSKDIKPGTILNAEIQAAAEPVITVPRRLIQYKNGMYGVFVEEKQTAVFKEVETGESFGNDIEIKSGLEEGMMVITDGYQFLETGNKLKTGKQ